jgi:DNA repair exonuclease SbcCD ATPase subunit
MVGGETPSSPPPRNGGWASLQEELDYYKTAYETLDAELQEFQSSSKELEAELERDVEESEKRERKLQEKVERLGFEAEEWKVCSPPRDWSPCKVAQSWQLISDTDKVQAEQDRSQQCAKPPAEGDYEPARCTANTATQAPGYRSTERRL